jgi:hypothetical protein
VDVTVTTAGGTSATSSADQFSYLITSLVEGLSFSTPIELEKALTLTLPSDGHIVDLGPLTISGAPGATAKVSLESKPAFESLAMGVFESTGEGIISSVEGFGPTGERMIGPVTVACTPPRSVLVGEIPIVATGAGGQKRYSASYNAECVIWPSGWNISGTANVTMSATGPETVVPGEEINLTEVSFTVTLPQKWAEWLYVLGGREARGTSSSKASISVVG